MNGLKFFILVVAVIAIIIIALSATTQNAIWKVPAIVGLCALIAGVVLHALNSKSK
jgi:hypothetical protein